MNIEAILGKQQPAGEIRRALVSLNFELTFTDRNAFTVVLAAVNHKKTLSHSDQVLENRTFDFPRLRMFHELRSSSVRFLSVNELNRIWFNLHLLYCRVRFVRRPNLIEFNRTIEIDLSSKTEQ